MITENGFSKKPLHKHQGFFIKHQSGMTLLEVMIAISIIAAIITVFVTKIDNSNSQMKESVRKIAIISRDLYHKAKLKQQTYRLVIDMKEGPDSEEAHTYWVEKGDKDFLSSSDSSHRAFNKSSTKSKAAKEEEEKKASVGGFTPATQVMKAPKKLPGALFFESVELSNQNKALTDGRVYIHYRPQGFVDEAAIHIKVDEQLRWTVVTHPLTGRGEIYPEYIELKEIRDQ